MFEKIGQSKQKTQQNVNKQQGSQQKADKQQMQQHAAQMAQQIVQMPKPQAKQQMKRIKKKSPQMAQLVQGFAQKMIQQQQAQAEKGQQMQSQRQQRRKQKSQPKAQNQKAKMQQAKKRQKMMKQKALQAAQKLMQMPEKQKQEKLDQMKKQSPKKYNLITKALDHINKQQKSPDENPRDLRVKQEMRKNKRTQGDKDKKNTNLYEIIKKFDDKGGEYISDVAKRYFSKNLNIEDHIDEMSESKSELYKIVQNYLDTSDDPATDGDQKNKTYSQEDH